MANPVITRITPSSGSPLGGDLITIEGTDIPTLASISFGAFQYDSTLATATSGPRITSVKVSTAADNTARITLITPPEVLAGGSTVSVFVTLSVSLLESNSLTYVFTQNAVLDDQLDLANPNGLGERAVPADASNPPDVISGGDDASTATSGGFCGAETRVSTNVCNSLHPAVCFTPNGNIGHAWHDTRDGVFEIYFRAIQGHLDEQRLQLGQGFAFDPKTGKPFNISCSGFSSTTGGSGSNGVLLTQGGGRLDVNTVSRVMVLSAARGSIEFQGKGVTPNSAVTIINGLNTGKTFYVSRLLAPTVAELVFVDGVEADADFVYSISSAITGLSTPEARLTCNPANSQFPDIVSDSAGRFHIVYQDNAYGNYELFYMQLYPKSIGKPDCSGASDALPQSNGFTPVPEGSSGSTTVFVPNPSVSATTPLKTTFLTTGDDGVIFTYGDKNLTDLIPSTDVTILRRTGLHRVFRDILTDSAWTGVSRAADRVTWDAQALDAGLTITPDYLAPIRHPIAGENDFGTKFTFDNIAVIAQSPPDKDVFITRIGIPLRPRCLPDVPANQRTQATQSLVSAPKKPVPPGFTDPVSLEDILTSPLVQIDENVPPRFTIDGDNSGSVFTNILTDNGRGELSRFVFNCDENNKGKSQPRFILGQRLCGQELCALDPTTTAVTIEAPKSAAYKIRLQVWQGPDYRLIPNQILSSQFSNAIKIIDKEFLFEPGDDLSYFSFKEGELRAQDGRFLFFVPIPGDDVEFFVEGVGGGHDVWSTNGAGTFDQYYVPFTIKPNAGLDLPVYYEGILAPPTSGATTIVNEDDDNTDGGNSGGPSTELTCFRIQLTPGYFQGIGGLIGASPDFKHDTVNDVITGSNGAEGGLGSLRGILYGDLSDVADAALSSAGILRASFKIYRIDRRNSTLDIIDLRNKMKNFTPPGDSVFKITMNGGEMNATSLVGIPCAEGLVVTPEPSCIETTQTNNSISSVTLFNTTHFQTAYPVGSPFYLSQGFSITTQMKLRRAKVFLAVRNFNATTHAGESVVCEIVSANSLGLPISDTVLGRVTIAAADLPRTFAADLGFPVDLGDPIPNRYAVSFNFCADLPAGNYALITRRSSKTQLAADDALIYDMARWAGVWTGTPINGLFGPITTTTGILNAYSNSNGGILGSWNLVHGGAPTQYEGIPLTFEFFDPAGPVSPDATYCEQQEQHLNTLLNAGEITTDVFNTRLAALQEECANVDDDDDDNDTNDDTDDDTDTDVGTIKDLIATPPIRLTKSAGDSVHPRLAVDSRDNIWLVYHSNRTGSNEVFLGRYYCGKWATSARGGADVRLSRAGDRGKTAMFPNIKTDEVGNAHIVYQSTDTDDGNSEIFYVRSTNRGVSFVPAKQITSSAGQALMPDIAISSKINVASRTTCDGTEDSTSQGAGRTTVVWHDNRFGNYEIMAGNKIDGEWESSGQGGVDTRITQAPGDSLFPRVAADHRGNIRVVYHDHRRGVTNPWIFMSTFNAALNRWDSSAQGGTDLPISIGNTDAESLHADIDIDQVDGVYISWHDTRFKEEQDVKEEILGTYCAKLDAPIAFCGPICTNVEAFVQTTVELLDPISGQIIDATNVPQIGIQITSPGATFVRISNDGEAYSEWMPFKPSASLDTMVVPWDLGSGSGKKNICVQVQDATTVGFPVCKDIFLQASLPAFKIEFFKDEALSIPLETFKDKPVAPSGDIYVRLTSSSPLVRPPTFDVISKGLRLIFNQETRSVSGISGFSGQDNADALGTVVAGDTQDTTAFSAFAGTEFVGRFHVHRDDGFFHLDGPARLIPHGKDIRGQVF